MARRKSPANRQLLTYEKKISAQRCKRDRKRCGQVSAFDLLGETIERVRQVEHLSWFYPGISGDDAQRGLDLSEGKQNAQEILEDTRDYLDEMYSKYGGCHITL